MADNQDMAIRHFLLTNDGQMEEFSEEEASRVANGMRPLPQHADAQLRYVQVAFDEYSNDDGEIRVQTMGAIVSFDQNGRLCSAGASEVQDNSLSHFEHDACVQFALRDALPEHYALN